MNNCITPYKKCFLAVPLALEVLPFVPRAIFSLQAGTITCEFQYGETVSIDIEANVFYPFALKKIFPTGTTISQIYIFK